MLGFRLGIWETYRVVNKTTKGNQVNKAELYNLAKEYIVAGFKNPNNDYKITDTVQTLSETKQNYFWELVDMAWFAYGNKDLIKERRGN